MRTWITKASDKHIMPIFLGAIVVVLLAGTAITIYMNPVHKTTHHTAPQDNKSTPSAAPKENNTQSTSNTPNTYDQLVLSSHPVAFWPLNTPGTQTNNLIQGSPDGTFEGGVSQTSSMPNGDKAVVFNGIGQYVSVASNPAFSVSTTHKLTWEGWIRPATVQFTHASSTGYVEWMGKCLYHAPGCEWAARMYSATTPQGRCNRLSAYIFNTSGGLGSGAYWQAACNTLQANDWLYVVGEYDASATPSGCNPAYPGSISIWVDGVQWQRNDHAPTGCMSQYKIRPTASTSPLTIGTVDRSTWFQGAIGKVAIYNYLLSPSQIASRYKAMTGTNPSGSCAYSCTLGS